MLDQRVADIEIVAAEQRSTGHTRFGVAAVIPRYGQAGQPLPDVRGDVLQLKFRGLIRAVEHRVQPALLIFKPARELLVALVERARLRRLVQHGRASWRDSVCHFVSSWVDAGPLKKKQRTIK